MTEIRVNTFMIKGNFTKDNKAFKLLEGKTEDEIKEDLTEAINLTRTKINLDEPTHIFFNSDDFYIVFEKKLEQNEWLNETEVLENLDELSKYIKSKIEIYD